MLVQGKISLSHLQFVILQIFSRRNANLRGLSNVSSILTGRNERIAYLHIEQGPRLEARNHKVGIVQGVCYRLTSQS